MSHNQKLLTTEFRILKLQVQRRLNSCLQLAETYFNRSFAMPEISYALRGMKAGVAHLQEHKIRFNPVLLQENQEIFIRQVVPHELAHILVYQLFGRVKPHGREWQMVMQEVFGLPAEVCHQFDTHNTANFVTYVCDCQTHQLSMVRHNKIARHKASYVCRQCKTPLRIKTI